MPEHLDPTSEEEIIKQHLPVASLAVGRAAVHAAIEQPTFGFEKTKSNLAVLVSELEPERLLAAARQQLAGLTPEQRAKAETFFSTETLPEWLQQATHYKPEQDIITALVEKDEQGAYRVGDQTFLNFLEWHNYRLASEQNNYERQQAPYQEQVFRQRFEAAVDNGWIPAEALGNMDRLDQIQFHIDDGFGTALEHKLAAVVGKADGTAYYVKLSPSIWRTPGLKHEATVAHELNHVMCGQDGFMQTDNHIFRPKASCGLYRTFEDGMGGHALDEAVTEHLAQSLIYGDIEAIDPSEDVRKESSGYFSERILLSHLCEDGVQPVDIRLFIAAQFEENQRSNHTQEADSARHRLTAALQQAFPFTDVIQELSALKPEEGKDDWKVLMDYTYDLVRRSDEHKHSIRMEQLKTQPSFMKSVKANMKTRSRKSKN